MKLLEIEGIGPKYAEVLAKQGLTTTEDLLKAGETAAGRHKVSESSGISEKLVLEWVNHADLCRINGIGSEYADLLEAAGVDTVPELAQRNAANLTEALTKVNDAKKLVRRTPSQSEVARWVDEAKTLPRAVAY